jgi:hypothetical protein
MSFHTLFNFAIGGAAWPRTPSTASRVVFESPPRRDVWQPGPPAPFHARFRFSADVLVTGRGAARQWQPGNGLPRCRPRRRSAAPAPVRQPPLPGSGVAGPQLIPGVRTQEYVAHGAALAGAPSVLAATPPARIVVDRVCLSHLHPCMKQTAWRSANTPARPPLHACMCTRYAVWTTGCMRPTFTRMPPARLLHSAHRTS